MAFAMYVPETSCWQMADNSWAFMSEIIPLWYRQAEFGMFPSTRYTHLKLNHDVISGYVPSLNKHAQTDIYKHKKSPEENKWTDEKSPDGELEYIT